MNEYKWIQTVGAPSQGDPRDGEMHKHFSDVLDQRFRLEPWDEQPDGRDAVYDLASSEPITDAEGRTVWIYKYVGLASDIYGAHEDEPDDD